MQRQQICWATVDLLHCKSIATGTLIAQTPEALFQPKIFSLELNYVR